MQDLYSGYSEYRRFPSYWTIDSLSDIQEHQVVILPKTSFCLSTPASKKIPPQNLPSQVTTKPLKKIMIPTDCQSSEAEASLLGVPVGVPAEELLTEVIVGVPAEAVDAELLVSVRRDEVVVNDAPE